jgi:uncharacterized protein (UPF0264 family)
MTGLLISVRSAEEAAVALAGGADVIDIKEPSRGALGPATPFVWDEVQRVVAGRRPVSVALGELLDDNIDELAAATAGCTFAKIGLAGCHDSPGWINRWLGALAQLPPEVSPVPVAYADWQAARAPSPRVAVALAAQAGLFRVLLDTFDKSRGDLLVHLTFDYLSEMADECREQNVRLALAGSLSAESIAELLPLFPEYVGVRGAACVGGRNGTIELSRVKSLAANLWRPAMLSSWNA